MTGSSPSPIAVCSTSDVAPGTARRFDVSDAYGHRHRICLVHIGDDWYAIGDECSHADFSLADGMVWEDECEIECPKHGSSFSLTTGQPQTLPATTPVPVYAVVLDGDMVHIAIEHEVVGVPTGTSEEQVSR
jgi:3-phenylpropionate/trans-cinnamate dioxygenase ferredoxin component